MLSVLTKRKKKRRWRKHKETSGGNGIVFDLDCGDGSTGVCVRPSSSDCFTKYIQLSEYQLYFNKADF